MPLPIKKSNPDGDFGPVSTRIKFGTISEKKGQRLGIYGSGGIGKTSLACQLPGKTAMLDADESLSTLRGQLELVDIPLPVIIPATNFGELLYILTADGWQGIDNIVIDTGTRVEEWAKAYTLANVKTKTCTSPKKLEDYGFGKGEGFLYETFISLIPHLDSHIRAGRNVVWIFHECINVVPNPESEDWQRYEPRLNNPKSGKHSIRLHMKEWLDHLLFVNYDVAVEKDERKGKGQGTRTIYTSELPFCMAKSRTTSDKFDVVHGQFDWRQIIK